MHTPDLPVGSLVLVTGVTGFVGSHVTLELLKNGYKVRGIIRNVDKANFLKEHAFKEYKDNFHCMVVPNIEVMGAFDEAVKDVDAICHVASPVTFDAKDPIKELINPAVNSTLNVLNSALKFGTKIQHVIFTSSVVTLLHPASPGYLYSDKDWNDEAFESLRNWKPGQAFDGYTAYVASKNEAEKAFWRFRDENKPHFRMSTVLPSYVFGPIIHHAKSISEISVSIGIVAEYYFGKKKNFDATKAASYVDVRDVALIHVRVLQKGKVSDGKRFIASAGSWTHQMIVDIIRKHFPETRERIPIGKPGENYHTDLVVDGRKAVELLGVEYRPLEKVIIDTCNSIKQLSAA